MTARKHRSLPSPSELRAQVLHGVQHASEPITAAALARQLAPRVAVRAPDVSKPLEELVAEGQLFRLPPKSAKASPRYWHSDPYELARADVLGLLQSTEEPFTAKDIAKRLTGPLHFTDRELTPILQACVADGELHALPPARARGAPRYARWNPREFFRRQLLRAVAVSGPLSAAQLKQAVKGVDAAEFASLLAELLEERRLFRYPPGGGHNKERFGGQPPSPDPYLAEWRVPLTRLVDALTAAGVDRQTLGEAFQRLLEQAGLTALPDSRRVRPSPDLVSLMRHIEPAADRGAFVAARDLRRCAAIDKLDFDRAVLELARQGRLMLHRHDFPAGLTAAEREELVTDGSGNYYVGMALRRSTE
uniref:Uncharacterized protein n=1 Tax=Schlesneria paludicola TaxID=360056 RepID=A0A7C4QT64_9PLAN